MNRPLYCINDGLAIKQVDTPSGSTEVLWLDPSTGEFKPTHSYYGLFSGSSTSDAPDFVEEAEFEKYVELVRGGVPPGDRDGIQTPIYVIDRCGVPVKAVDLPDGRMDVISINWATGQFERSMGYLSLFLYKGKRRELGTLGRAVTQEEFDAYIPEFKKSRGIPTRK